MKCVVYRNVTHVRVGYFNPQEAMTEADVNRSHTLDFYEYLLVADKLFSRKGTLVSKPILMY